MAKWRAVITGLLLVSGSLSASISSFTLAHPGLTIQQRGQWYSLPLGQIPESSRGEVTKVYWKLNFLTPLPSSLNVVLCRGSICRGLNGVEGSSTLFRGESNQGQWRLLLQLSGSGRQAPATLTAAVQLTVNSRVPGNKQGPKPLH